MIINYVTLIRNPLRIHTIKTFCDPHLRKSSALTVDDDIHSIDFKPCVNVLSNADGYIVHFELPGIIKDDIKIQIHDNTLKVTGERKKGKSEEIVWLHRERPSGRFERSIRFKKFVDASKIDAEYQNGVLKITIPYADEAKPKEISIQ